MKGDGNGNTKYRPLFTSPAATNLCQQQCREKVLPKVGVRVEEENSVFAMSQNSLSHTPPQSPWHSSGNIRDGLEALFNLEENLEVLSVLCDLSGEEPLKS